MIGLADRVVLGDTVGTGEHNRPWGCGWHYGHGDMVSLGDVIGLGDMLSLGDVAMAHSSPHLGRTQESWFLEIQRKTS